MKIINPSYEILTDISPFGTLELEQIERAARTCYKSEDKILDQAESAKKLIKKLIENGHEAMLEHSILSVKFICDRGVSHELVRHRLASFAQESTRYCNYSKDNFDNQITVIEPLLFNALTKKEKEQLEETTFEAIAIDPFYSNVMKKYFYWFNSCVTAEKNYNRLLYLGCSPQEARSVLPNSLKTEVVMTANYREWRHILELRCSEKAHPEMRRSMLPLLEDLHGRIPVIFDDVYDRYYETRESA